jgi:predicted DNA-binding transcriptional regulator AlpA
MSTENTPSPVLSSGRNFSTPEAMSLLGYKGSTEFWQAVRRAGIPYIRISARRAIFRERDLEAWMDAHTVGAPVRSVASQGGQS